MRPSRYSHGYVSSTTLVDIIDKPGLRYWYGSKGTAACERIKKTSQVIGHGVHKAIESYLKAASIENCVKDLDDSQIKMFSQLVEWCKEKKLRIKALEDPLYWYCKVHHRGKHVIKCHQDCPPDCKEFTLAGTPDVVCNKYGIIDWKTDRVPRDTISELETAAKYYWQNASYALMANRMYGMKINTAYTVRSTSEEKVKEGTQKKENLRLPPFVQVKYSDDYTFAEYYFPDLTAGMKEVKMLHKIWSRVKKK